MKTELEVITAAESRSLKSLESKIKRGLATFFDVGEALTKIRDERLYRAEYKTFEAYCYEKWAISRSYAYRLIGSAEVVETLSPTGNKPTSESVVRPMLELKPTEQIKAWTSAVEHAANGTPTAAEVVAAVKSLIGNGHHKAAQKAATKPKSNVTLATEQTTVGELIKLAIKHHNRVELAFGDWRVIVTKVDAQS